MRGCLFDCQGEADVQLSAVDQSRTTPQDGVRVAVGIRYTLRVDRRLVCTRVPVHQGCTAYILLRFVPAPGDIMVQRIDVNSAIGSPSSPPLGLNLS